VKRGEHGEFKKVQTKNEGCHHKKRKENNMNKGDLISQVSKVVGTKKEAQAAVECVFASIKEALTQDEAVQLIGFGTFKTIERKARKGRNPQTGEEIQIEAKKVPKFVPGQALKNAVN
jgi:nucleoid DNA-binding protein